MRVTIEKLAPTGEGIARTAEGVGFVAQTLPGEEVQAEVVERHKNYWRGRPTEILRAASARVEGAHASCAGCDWAHFDPQEALAAKRSLFLETMERIGGQSPARFGALPALPSPGRYRLRNRFHVSGTGPDLAIGYFTRRTHRVQPLLDCEAVSTETIGWLSPVREALARTGACIAAISLFESLDASRRLGRLVLERTDAGALRDVAGALAPFFSGLRLEQEKKGLRSEVGEASLTIEVGGRPFPVSVNTFFQTNRHLVGRLYQDVRDLAAEVSTGRAIDAFGGGGLFAGALLDAGHEVTTVEGNRSAVADAERAHALWKDAARWSVVRSDVASFAACQNQAFDLAVVDPPRAGLGTELSALLAQRVSSRIVYVSCEPATLARDLPSLTKRFDITAARLYDLFAGTHRVEAMVVLDRKSAS